MYIFKEAETDEQMSGEESSEIEGKVQGHLVAGVGKARDKKKGQNKLD